MIKFDCLKGALVAASAVMLLLPGFASAQDRDTQEVLRYTLTEAGLEKFIQATRKLAELPEGIPIDCDDDSDSKSLDQTVAKFDAAPGVKAAIQSGGMTTREYVVFSWSLLQNGLAAWALGESGGKLPPGVSKANVDFHTKHEADLQALEGLKTSNECGDESAEDDV